MAFPKIKISDDSGNTVGVNDNRLNVNAYLNATPTIDIGDVSLLLDGTAADYGTGNVNTSGRTLRVTIASDDNHFGAVGGSAVVDGTVHQQLRYIGNNLNTTNTNTANCDTSLNNIESYTGISIKATGTEFGTSDVGSPAVTVRNDTLANLDVNIATGDYSMLQTNAIGALYTTGESKQNVAVTDYGFGIMGEAKSIDGSALPNTVSEGNAIRLAVSRAGIAYTCLTDTTGSTDIGDAIGELANVIGTSGSTGPTKCLSIGATEAGGDISELTIASGKLLVTESNSSSIKTAVELIDNTIGTHDSSVGSQGIQILYEAKNFDNSVLPSDVSHEGDAVIPACSLHGVQYTTLVDERGIYTPIAYDDSAQVATPAIVNVGGEYRSSDTTYADGDATILQTNVNGFLKVTVGSSSSFVYQDDADYTLGSDYGVPIMGFAGAQNIATGDVGVLQCSLDGYLKVCSDYDTLSDGINDDVDTSAEQLASGGCKRVDMMADPANTGDIWVGASGVVNDGSGGGIRMQPGDFYSMDTDNLGNIYLAATVANQKMMYITHS